MKTTNHRVLTAHTGSVPWPAVVACKSLAGLMIIKYPELFARRIGRFARRVGGVRVPAGTDCGLSIFADFGPVDPAIARARPGALVKGAAIASNLLWKIQ